MQKLGANLSCARPAKRIVFATFLFVGLFLTLRSEAAIFSSGRLQGVAFAAISPGITLTVKSSRASLSQFGDVFAAGDAQVAVELKGHKQTFQCRHLSVQMIDNHTTCELAEVQNKTVVIDFSGQSLRIFSK